MCNSTNHNWYFHYLQALYNNNNKNNNINNNINNTNIACDDSLAAFECLCNECQIWHKNLKGHFFKTVSDLRPASILHLINLKDNSL